jgi:hypothetical protein
MGVHSALRSHIDGADKDLNELTGVAIIGAEGFDDRNTDHFRAIALARVAGGVAVNLYNAEAGGFASRLLSRAELLAGRVFDPLVRAAIESGVPQASAQAEFNNPLRNIR